MGSANVVVQETGNMAETHMQLNWKLNAEESSNKNQLRKTNPKNMMKDKYKFREASLKKRNEVEVRAKKEGPKKRGPKPRPKPQPMSKYHAKRPICAKDN